MVVSEALVQLHQRVGDGHADVFVGEPVIHDDAVGRRADGMGADEQILLASAAVLRAEGGLDPVVLRYKQFFNVLCRPGRLGNGEQIIRIHQIEADVIVLQIVRVKSVILPCLLSGAHDVAGLGLERTHVGQRLNRQQTQHQTEQQQNGYQPFSHVNPPSTETAVSGCGAPRRFHFLLPGWF